MSDVKTSKKEIVDLINSVGSKVSEYLATLKHSSTEEIMSGSIPEAQKLLNQILPIEQAYNNLAVCHSDFLKVLDGENPAPIKKNEQSQPKESEESEEDLNKIDLSDMEFTPSSLYRISILKALIYLGGSAKLTEVASFIEKEMKGKFKPADNEKGANGFGKLWIEMVHTEKENMISEGLITEDKEENQWEIVQEGIDYLAQNSN